MQTLDELAIKHQTDKASPQHDYARVYEKYLGTWRDREFTLLEIGVASGASLRMWWEYFPKAHIYGIDINPDCIQDGVFIGNQVDTTWLDSVLLKIGTPDVVIDDGGHVGEEIITTFKHLFPKISPGGYYIVEDTHCFYHPLYAGNPATNGRTNVFNFFSQLIGDVDLDGRGMTGNVERAIGFHEGAMPQYSRILEAMFIHTSLWWFKRR